MKLFNESGGHRIQRVPPTEKRGRVHTSTVVVAVYENNPTVISVKDSDIRVEWFSGTGKGGQHRNKHQNSCRLVHEPTGISASAQTRSRKNSYDLAYSTLVDRINEKNINSETNKIAKDKREKFGSGERGDKIRTYRFQDDIVKDHRSNKTMSCSSIMNGDFNKIW